MSCVLILLFYCFCRQLHCNASACECESKWDGDGADEMRGCRAFVYIDLSLAAAVFVIFVCAYDVHRSKHTKTDRVEMCVCVIWSYWTNIGRTEIEMRIWFLADIPIAGRNLGVSAFFLLPLFYCCCCCYCSIVCYSHMFQGRNQHYRRSSLCQCVDFVVVYDVAIDTSHSQIHCAPCKQTHTHTHTIGRQRATWI